MSPSLLRASASVRPPASCSVDAHRPDQQVEAAALRRRLDTAVDQVGVLQALRLGREQVLVQVHPPRPAHDHADDFLEPRAQRPRRPVRREAELGHGRQHAVPGFLPRVALPVEHAGDRGDGHARGPGHVIDRRRSARATRRVIAAAPWPAAAAGPSGRRAPGRPRRGRQPGPCLSRPPLLLIAARRPAGVVSAYPNGPNKGAARHGTQSRPELHLAVSAYRVRMAEEYDYRAALSQEQVSLLLRERDTSRIAPSVGASASRLGLRRAEPGWTGLTRRSATTSRSNVARTRYRPRNNREIRLKLAHGTHALQVYGAAMVEPASKLDPRRPDCPMEA